VAHVGEEGTAKWRRLVLAWKDVRVDGVRVLSMPEHSGHAAGAGTCYIPAQPAVVTLLHPAATCHSQKWWLHPAYARPGNMPDILAASPVVLAASMGPKVVGVLLALGVCSLGYLQNMP
jgi:hypothetical protein